VVVSQKKRGRQREIITMEKEKSTITIKQQWGGKEQENNFQSRLGKKFSKEGRVRKAVHSREAGGGKKSGPKPYDGLVRSLRRRKDDQSAKFPWGQFRHTIKIAHSTIAFQGETAHQKGLEGPEKCELHGREPKKRCKGKKGGGEFARSIPKIPPERGYGQRHLWSRTEALRRYIGVRQVDKG